MIARYGKERSWIFEKVTLGIKYKSPKYFKILDKIWVNFKKDYINIVNLKRNLYKYKNVQRLKMFCYLNNPVFIIKSNKKNIIIIIGEIICVIDSIIIEN